LALVLTISKRYQEDNAFFDEQGGKVERYITKNCSYNFLLSGIGYLLNLPNGFQNPARKPAKC